MIAYTLQQAAGRVSRPLDVVFGWVSAGVLHAVHNPVDGHLYVEEEHLLDVERDMWLAATEAGPPPDRTRPDPLPIPVLAAWLWDHGRPVTERMILRWVETGALTAVVPGRRGRGQAALYDPLDALAVAEAKVRRLPRATDNTQEFCDDHANPAGQAC